MRNACTTRAQRVRRVDANALQSLLAETGRMHARRAPRTAHRARGIVLVLVLVLVRVRVRVRGRGVPAVGFEPTTNGLQNRCSAN